MITQRARWRIMIALLVVLWALSCGKDDQTCIDCSAVCAGTSSESMSYCGDKNDVDAQEAAFRSANSGCEVTCTRR